MTSTRNTENQENELFNSYIKEQYLDTVSEVSRQSYKRIFKYTSPFERALAKDLNKFKFEEMEKVLYSFEAKNRNTLETYSSIISAYLNWCAKKYLITENILADLKPSDFERYLINKEEYITEKKLRRYEDMCENYQDAALMRLLFIGVVGKKCSEIRNLKWSDIDEKTMTVKLTNSLLEDADGFPIKYTTRHIKIDEYTYNLLKGAYLKNEYFKTNGDMQARDNIREYTDLVRNEYVIRPSITRVKNQDAPAGFLVINRRITMLGKKLGIKYMSIKWLQRSGMIYEASKIVKDIVTIEDIKVIANKFDIKSYHNLKSYITMENIDSLYNGGSRVV